MKTGANAKGLTYVALTNPLTRSVQTFSHASGYSMIFINASECTITSKKFYPSAGSQPDAEVLMNGAYRDWALAAYYANDHTIGILIGSSPPTITDQLSQIYMYEAGLPVFQCVDHTASEAFWKGRIEGA